MQTRKIGKTGIEVAPLMLGGNVFGWTADAATSYDILDAFVDTGFNFIDTADVYSNWVPGHQGGESETIIGQWFARSGKRSKVILATKVGMDMGDGNKGLSRKHILRAVEDSLRRLQTDYIDLYFSHIDDASTPLQETLEAYQQLIQQGKVRIIGASNYKGDRVRQAAAIAKNQKLPAYQVLQNEYNLYSRREFETDLQPVAQELNLCVTPHFALASGFLTGKYKSIEDTRGKAREARVARYFDERGMRILSALREITRETGIRPACIALAWLLEQPTILAPVVSVTSVEQLETIVMIAHTRLGHVDQARLYKASNHLNEKAAVPA